MKLSLRNLALAGTIMVAGVAMAQDAAVNVTCKWKHDLTSYGTADTRFGTGVNGKIYFANKTANVVSVVDADGESVYATGVCAGLAITSDDAGNLLVNSADAGWPGATCGSKFVIIKTDGTQVPLEIVYPEDVEVARIDQLGRIAGDMTSAEGAYLYMTPNGGTVFTVKIAECEQVVDAFDYPTIDGVAPAAVNTSSVAQPLYTFEELEDLGDEAVNGFALRNRSTKTIFYRDFDNSDWVKFPLGATANTQEGFDVFSLGDAYYTVQPAKKAANYESTFIIVDAEGNTIYTEESDPLGNGSQCFGSYVARKVADNKVELYQFVPTPVGARAALYEITLPGGEEPVAPLYICGGMTGWDPANPGEFTYADGLYYYAFEAGSAPVFKISTTKGTSSADWTGFNAGGFNVEFGNSLQGAGEYTLVPNADPANIELPQGTWNITVDLAASLLIVDGTADAFEAPELYLRGVIQGLDHWNSMAYKFVREENLSENGEVVYTLQVEGGLQAGDEFKIDDGNWGQHQYTIKDSSVKVSHGQTFEFCANGLGNTNNTSVAAAVEPHATLTFYLNPDRQASHWLTVNKSTGVEDVEVAEEAAPATFYNLQGVQVNAENLPAGVYVKVANGKASKVVVK